jgi:HAD superfamily 5'-nucleotidase-like hydrolase
MNIYTNRVLNLSQIKAIGFDMDYTLVEYHTSQFEGFVHQSVLKCLAQHKDYPKEITKIKFNFDQVIQGLVIDRDLGNILKLSRFGKVKQAFHGTKEMSYSGIRKTYKNRVIELNDSNIQSLDTSFSVANGVLFLQLVDMIDSGQIKTDYKSLSYDIKEMIDLIHRDGSLKKEITSNKKKYVVQNPKTAEYLERLKRDGKKLLLITNSDYLYSNNMMEFAFDPFLKEHKSWRDLFQVVITFAMKPRFFTESSTFLKVDPSTGLMENYEGSVASGVYQGGNANQLQNDLGIEGEDFLYLGDHIFGDVVSIKKTCNWRTALVLSPLKEEMKGIEKSATLQSEIHQLMEEKVVHEHRLKKEKDRTQIEKINELNSKISERVQKIKTYFNPHWGELMRAGAEESRFADQVEKYACIYMERVSDLDNYTSDFYFRPLRRYLPHELQH